MNEMEERLTSTYRIKKRKDKNINYVENNMRFKEQNSNLNSIQQKNNNNKDNNNTNDNNDNEDEDDRNTMEIKKSILELTNQVKGLKNKTENMMDDDYLRKKKNQKRAKTLNKIGALKLLINNLTSEFKDDNDNT